MQCLGGDATMVAAQSAHCWMDEAEGMRKAAPRQRWVRAFLNGMSRDVVRSIADCFSGGWAKACADGRWEHLEHMQSHHVAQHTCHVSCLHISSHTALCLC